MWKLIDSKTDYFNSGFDVLTSEHYLLKNTDTGESRWVDEYELRKLKRLGLVI